MNSLNSQIINKRFIIRVVKKIILKISIIYQLKHHLILFFDDCDLGSLILILFLEGSYKALAVIKLRQKII